MPASAHHFIPVWQSLEAERTLRSKDYGPARKRKRQPVQDDSDDEGAYSLPSSPPQIASRNHHHQKPGTLAKARDPHHVAGHPKSLPLPDYPFPHAPVKQARRVATSETAQRSLADLKPPLYVPPVPDAEDARTSLRRHHLSVMTTIMHTSLQRGDFIRAGRAWGMILRTEVLGRAIDVRTHERWGIGAEILLRQHNENSAESSLDEHDDQSGASEVTFGDEGFDLARKYYERLILQFPYQKTHPNAVSSLTFYPAMYGLGVYQIQQNHKQALQRVETQSPSPSQTHDDLDADETRLESRILDVQRHTLDKSTGLADRMNEILLSPPYNSHPPLIQLRAMLALWIVDLISEIIDVDKKNQSTYKARHEREKEMVRRFVDEIRRTGRALPEFFTLDS